MMNMLNKNKKGFQISFAWLFAIIVGAFILFLAIYAATKVINTGSEAASAQTSAEIEALLNPLETGFETAQKVALSLPVDTRIHNSCKSVGEGVFGEQRINVSQKRFNRWSETNLETAFRSKYIFSENPVQGREFFLFSKPFEFPFKVADVIYLTSAEKEYCFIAPPKRIEDELEKLGQENLIVGFNSQCPDGSINVCFGADTGTETNCDITVNENLSSVTKRGIVSYYETDALMYAAVFSDKETYECQVQRLMQRAEALSLIYEDKIIVQSQQGCRSDVTGLFAFISALSSYQGSESLVTLNSLADDIQRQNRIAECRLW